MNKMQKRTYTLFCRHGRPTCFTTINGSRSRAIENHKIRHVTRRTGSKVAREAPLGKLRHISSPAGKVFEFVSLTGGAKGTRQIVLHNILGSQQNRPEIYNPVSDIAQPAHKGTPGG